MVWCCKYLCFDKDKKPYIVQTCGSEECSAPEGCQLIDKKEQYDCKGCPDKIIGPKPESSIMTEKGLEKIQKTKVC